MQTSEQLLKLINDLYRQSFYLSLMFLKYFIIKDLEFSIRNNKI